MSVDKSLPSSSIATQDGGPPKFTVKSSDMEESMQQRAVDTAVEAMDKFQVEKDIAAYIKKDFDTRYGTVWHCIVGKNFGSFVTHETKHFFYAYVGPVAVVSEPFYSKVKDHHLIHSRRPAVIQVRITFGVDSIFSYLLSL